MIRRVLPFVAWFRGYSKASFKIDLISGLTVALVLIPQSMAYAQLAGLPAYYGLYASLLPPTIAALFGSSRQLATGPVAVVSLMTAASLGPLASTGSDGYIAYAVLLSLVVGVFQFALGVLRLGVVVNFLSHPVVNGFTNGAALIIATSQLSKLFGVHVDSAEHHYETVARVVESAFHFTHWPTLAFGAAAFAVMYGLKRFNPKIPYVLVAVSLAIIVSWLAGYRHDESVALTQIESDRCHELIAEFNRATEEIQSLGAERAAIAENGSAGGGDGHRTAQDIDRAHETALIELRIEDATQRAAAARGELREMFFAGVRGANGELVFVPRDEVGSRETDGRTWRLRVGRSALDADAIVMAGGGDVVGTIPSGLPRIAAPRLDLNVMITLFPNAVIISLLGFMEAISIAKAMAAKTGQRLDPNQELIGQGLGNIIGSFTSAYPVSGSFSRSAVNLQAGARTGLSSVITTLTVVIVLLFLTPLLYHLPQAVLASVIMMAVLGLLNVTGFVHAWKAQWYDGAISVVSFIATLVFAPHLDKGIMVGVVLSLGVFLYKSMRPTVASLGLQEGTFRDARRFGLKQCERLALVRFDGPLFFANASFLEEQVTARLREKPQLKEILIVASGINDMDASGEEALSLLVDRVRSAGCGISLCGVKEPVMAVLKRTYLYEKIGADNFYEELPDAVSVLHPKAHGQAEVTTCPLNEPSILASEAEGEWEELPACQ